MSNKPKLPRKVHDVIDMDYMDELSPAEVDFMIKFIAEYYYGNFKSRPLHRTVKQRRELGRENHARRRDVWNQMDRTEREWGDDET